MMTHRWIDTAPPLRNGFEQSSPPVLSEVLHKALTETRATGAAIHVDGGDSLIGRRRGDEWTLESRPERRSVLLHPSVRSRPEARSAEKASDGRVSTADIVYGEERLGTVEWLAREAPNESARGQELADRLARESAFLIKRLQVEQRMQERLGLDLRWIGRGPSIRLLEEEIERVASSDLPVIIEGELGLEKLMVACFLHFAGPHGAGPFVEVKCGAHGGDDRADPESWVERAQGGTLFFNGVEQLPMTLQQRLPAALTSRVGQWLSASGSDSQPAVRVIASSASGIEQFVEQGKLFRPLLAELNFLRLRIPPLRRRPEDIPWLAEHFLARHRRRPSQRFTDEALRLLMQYHWPENLFELERVIARAAIMVGSTKIGPDELARHAPELLQSRPPKGVEAPAESPKPADSPEARSIEAPAPKTVEPVSGEEAAVRLAAGKLEFVEDLHPGLQRALRHIAESYQESISMSELAKESFISASHLSFLFRTGLGVSFKTLLAAVRIEHAKRLLAAAPDRLITDISLEVGFCDLSHFEKTFKRWARHSPREYRRLALKQAGRRSETSSLDSPDD